MRLDRRTILATALTLVGGVVLHTRGLAQGCMPATPQSLPLHLLPALADEFPMSRPGGDERLDFDDSDGDSQTNQVGTSDKSLVPPRAVTELQLLEARHWSYSVAFRYYKSGDKYVGSNQVVEGKNEAVGEYPSLDLTGTYAFNPRWSVSVSLPLVNPKDTFAHADGQRHTTGPGLSIGDLRVVGSYWLFDPARPRPGNAVVGLGIKVPTGDYDAVDTFYNPDGTPVEAIGDLAVQPGDGGWGLILAAQGFQTLGRRIYFYGDGFYLINPRETNGAVTQTVEWLTGEPIPLSVPDYYQARAGLGLVAWPRHGISLTLGMRLDGIPTEDLVGGSEGFRRPGYNLAFDPGISVTWGANTLSVYIPVAVARSQKQSLPEQSLGLHLGGSMSAEALLVGFSRRLGKSGAAER